MIRTALLVGALALGITACAPVDSAGTSYSSTEAAPVITVDIDQEYLDNLRQYSPLLATGDKVSLAGKICTSLDRGLEPGQVLALIDPNDKNPQAAGHLLVAAAFFYCPQYVNPIQDYANFVLSGG